MIGGMANIFKIELFDFWSGHNLFKQENRLFARYIQIMWKIERGVIFDYNKRRVPPKSAPAK